MTPIGIEDKYLYMRQSKETLQKHKNMFKGRNGARKFSFFGYCYSSYGDENDDDEDGCLFKFLLLLFGQRLSILKERTKKKFN